jgi:hypothetical protein
MTLLPDVRRQLDEAARRRVAARRPSLRLPRSRRGLIVALVALLGTAGAAYGASQILRGAPPTRYVNAALAALVKRDPACAGTAITGSLSSGAPSPAMLGLLGVLRRPATTADAFPPPTSRPPRPPGRLSPRQAYRLAHPLSAAARLARFGVNVYVRYVRRARVAFGAAYYVIPTGAPDFEAPPPARCTAELRRDLPRMPAAIRGAALRIVSSTLAYQRRADRPHESVCLTAVTLAGPLAGSGGGGCGVAPAEIRTGGGLFGTTSGGTDGATILSGLVPDGVATVELDFRTRTGGRVSTTTRPVGNVVVARIPRGGTARAESRMGWRGANGAVLRAISQP